MFGKFEALLAMIVIILVVSSHQRFPELARKVGERARSFLNKRNEAS